ncbi:recombinase family protein [Corynebacterium aurimucosum]|uniref:recombinase family protein n=1 Tax=Corynebacterium aurimucosum TaxID=169292 RepID=UPI000C80DE36|nr:recombinase family protein [Corynebacterium aurimucosum]PMC68453.1 transposase [Corynebacterium aurimucosum]
MRATPAALDYLREGDRFVCVSMDRLARSLGDLHNIVTELTERGVEVQFLKEAQTHSRDSSPVSKLMLGLLGSVAEFERSLIRERQAEGIAKAKERGVYKGRSKSLSDAEVNSMKAAVDRGVPKAKVAREYGISCATLYRYLKG